MRTKGSEPRPGKPGKPGKAEGSEARPGKTAKTAKVAKSEPSTEPVIRKIKTAARAAGASTSQPEASPAEPVIRKIKTAARAASASTSQPETSPVRRVAKKRAPVKREVTAAASRPKRQLELPRETTTFQAVKLKQRKLNPKTDQRQASVRLPNVQTTGDSAAEQAGDSAAEQAGDSAADQADGTEMHSTGEELAEGTEGLSADEQLADKRRRMKRLAAARSKRHRERLVGQSRQLLPPTDRPEGEFTDIFKDDPAGILVRRSHGKYEPASNFTLDIAGLYHEEDSSVTGYVVKLKLTMATGAAESTQYMGMPAMAVTSPEQFMAAIGRFPLYTMTFGGRKSGWGSYIMKKVLQAAREPWKTYALTRIFGHQWVRVGENGQERREVWVVPTSEEVVIDGSLNFNHAKCKVLGKDLTESEDISCLYECLPNVRKQAPSLWTVSLTDLASSEQILFNYLKMIFQLFSRNIVQVVFAIGWLLTGLSSIAKDNENRMLLIICGRSGSGKTTLSRLLLAMIGNSQNNKMSMVQVIRQAASQTLPMVVNELLKKRANVFALKDDLIALFEQGGCRSKANGTFYPLAHVGFTTNMLLPELTLLDEWMRSRCCFINLDIDADFDDRLLVHLQNSRNTARSAFQALAAMAQDCRNNFSDGRGEEIHKLVAGRLSGAPARAINCTTNVMKQVVSLLESLPHDMDTPCTLDAVFDHLRVLAPVYGGCPASLLSDGLNNNFRNNDAIRRNMFICTLKGMLAVRTDNIHPDLIAALPNGMDAYIRDTLGGHCEPSLRRYFVADHMEDSTLRLEGRLRKNREYFSNRRVVYIPLSKLSDQLLKRIRDAWNRKLIKRERQEPPDLADKLQRMKLYNIEEESEDESDEDHDLDDQESLNSADADDDE